MGWRDRLLRILGQGLVDARGRRLDPQRVHRALDRLESEEEAEARLDALSSEQLRRELLRAYDETRGRESGADGAEGAGEPRGGSDAT